MGDFFDTLNTPKSNISKSVTDYIRLENDKPIKVQLLSPVGKVNTHWMPTDGKKMPIRCLNEGCPVCNRNLGIEDQKNDPLFVKRDQNYIVNVMDLSQVKICPKCQQANEKNTTKCINEECQTILVDVDTQPLKAVRYLEGTWTLFEQLKQTAEALEEQGDNIATMPLSIRKSKASNDKTTYVAIPSPADAINPSDFQNQLFDYSKTGIHLTYNEMIILMNGGSFKEVMKNRSSKEENKKSELDQIFGEKE